MPFNEGLPCFFLVIKDIGRTKKITTTGESTQVYKTEASEVFFPIAEVNQQNEQSPKHVYEDIHCMSEQRVV